MNAAALSRVSERLDRGNHLARQISRDASAPSASSARRAGRPHADGGHLRYENTSRFIGLRFCRNELILEFPTKSMPSGFSRRVDPEPGFDRSKSLARLVETRSLSIGPDPLALRGVLRFMGCVAYGQRSVPVASTRMRRHLAVRHERRGTFGQ